MIKNINRKAERRHPLHRKITIDFSTPTAAILPRNGLAWGARLHIARGKGGRARKRNSARGGMCDAPTGASPRKPPTRSFFTRYAFSTHYKTEDFVEWDPKIAVDLPNRQIFKARFRQDPPALAAHQNRGRVVPARHPPSECVPTPNLSLTRLFSNRKDVRYLPKI